MGQERWKRIAALLGYGVGVLCIVGGAVTGQLVLVLLGLVILAIVLLTANGG